MNIEELKALQKRIGATPNGIWDQKCRRALRQHILSLMPRQSPWPKPDYNSMVAFYGQPGDESNLVRFEFPFRTFFGGKLVRHGRAHKKVVPSLLRVLNKIGTRFSGVRGIMEEAEDYGGIYNFRRKRAGMGWSKHAWGAAIDMDADDNSMHLPWPTQADMPIEIIEAFAEEGWSSGAVFWGKDAMHHEATDLR